MRYKTLFIINTILAAVYGITFILFPGTVLSLFGVTVDPTSIYLGQVFGAALVSFGVLTWLARNAEPSPLRDSIVLSLLVGDVIGFAVSLIAQLGGVANALGWTTVVVYLLLGIGYAYVYFTEGRRSMRTMEKA